MNILKPPSPHTHTHTQLVRLVGLSDMAGMESMGSLPLLLWSHTHKQLYLLWNTQNTANSPARMCRQTDWQMYGRSEHVQIFKTGILLGQLLF